MAENLTPCQAARQMGCTLDWIYRELRAGRFRGAVKSGKHWKIPVQVVQARLEAKKQ
jgi:excisionase family DNA binding protein